MNKQEEKAFIWLFLRVRESEFMILRVDHTFVDDLVKDYAYARKHLAKHTEITKGISEIDEGTKR